jgi:hypothetical protein
LVPRPSDWGSDSCWAEQLSLLAWTWQRSTGFAPQRRTGFAPPRSTGFAPPRSTGFAPPRSTGFAPPRSTGFAAQRSTGLWMAISSRTGEGYLARDCGWLSRAGRWMAFLSRTVDGFLEPACGWLSRAGLWMASAKNVSGQGQERGPVPRTGARAKNVGQCQLL